MLEGILRGKKGLFPSHCVQEVRLRNPNSVRQAITTAPRAQTGLDNSNVSNHIQQRHFATAQRAKDAMYVYYDSILPLTQKKDTEKRQFRKMVTLNDFRDFEFCIWLKKCSESD